MMSPSQPFGLYFASIMRAVEVRGSVVSVHAPGKLQVDKLWLSVSSLTDHIHVLVLLAVIELEAAVRTLLAAGKQCCSG